VRYLLDTNIWIYALAGDALVRRFLESATLTGWVGYSVISRIEVFSYPSMTGEAERAALEVLGQYHEVQLDGEVVQRTIDLRKAARIKTPDAIIAASALINGATLVTRNVDDFKHLTGLALVDPCVRSGGTGK
jgi:hypothetical protein